MNDFPDLPRDWPDEPCPHGHGVAWHLCARCFDKRVKARMAENNEIDISIEATKTETEVPIDIYAIKVSTPKAEWHETYGSKEALNAFLRGVQAGAAMLGQYIKMPESW